MKTFLKIFASLLLFVNGIGAIYGGWNLITHPDGSSIELSLQFLKHTPFNDYFTPGIILFIANGLFSLFVLATIIFHFKNYAGYIIAQGVILTGWIIIQIIMIREIYY